MSTGMTGILTAMQQRFVAEYSVSRNATQAYLKAGYKVRNNKVAGTMGHRLLKNAEVAAAIRAAEEQLSAKIFIDAARVIRGLYREATLGDLDGGSSPARIKAWEVIGRSIGMFVDRHVHSGDPTNPILIEHKGLSHDERLEKLRFILECARHRRAGFLESGRVGAPRQLIGPALQTNHGGHLDGAAVLREGIPTLEHQAIEGSTGHS